ncbi:rhomboid family intramembrane serine protease [uncultured Mesonia sp.]|uniref:rhomboid family intramembrane serine protease n=1 Tax=uncultured Mesonia sp. TaxID=399731 RepID=UPI00374F683A
MQNQKQIHTWSAGTLLIPLFSVLLLWIVYWFEIKFHINLNSYGVGPKSLKGLIGVFCAPFIHGSINHLYNNSIPLFVLLMSLLYFYKPIAGKVLLYGFLIAGVLTWLLGKSGSVHIGASGIIYMLASFLFFKGIWSKHYRLIALALLVVFVYGSLVWGLFPGERGVSWEGHLAGFIAGLGLALFFKSRVIEKLPVYDWQKPDYNEAEDVFMQHFDADGNFVPSQPPLLSDKEVDVKLDKDNNKDDSVNHNFWVTTTTND